MSIGLKDCFMFNVSGVISEGCDFKLACFEMRTINLFKDETKSIKWTKCTLTEHRNALLFQCSLLLFKSS